jgi:hypothetical protein
MVKSIYTSTAQATLKSLLSLYICYREVPSAILKDKENVKNDSCFLSPTLADRHGLKNAG